MDGAKCFVVIEILVMNKRVDAVFLLVCLIIYGSGFTQTQSLNRGSAVVSTSNYDFVKNRFGVARAVRFLFRDSMIIAERSRLNTHTNMSTGEKRQWTDVMGYTFIDLRTKSFYLYNRLSPKAKLEESYLQPQEGRPKGGWNLFRKPAPFKSGSIQLADTIVGKTNFQRWKSFYPWDLGGSDTAYYSVYYFDCACKVPFINLGKVSTVPKGCILTRVEETYLHKEIRILDHVLLERESLTAKEEKVFDAWKKYAKKHPAKIAKTSE